ncbi:MAG: ATP-binding protein [bacterium]
MTFGIKSRLILSHLAIAAVAAVAASIYLSISFKELQVKYQEHSLLSSAYALADALETDFGTPQGLRQTRHAMRKLAIDDPGVFAVVDRNGQVLATTIASTPEGSTLSGIESVLSGKPYIQVTPGTKDDDQHIVVLVPIEHNGKVVGAVRAWVSEKDYRNSLAPIKKITALALSGVIVFSVVVSLVLAQALIIPIRKMRQLSKRIAGGDFETRVREPSGDELGELSEDLNTMASRLQELERARRDFMGNISHELRSPVSNIRITSEVLQRRAERLGDDSAKLFGTVIAETERLELLIDELLELSAIMAGVLILEKEVFDLKPMLEELIENISPRAHQKNINIGLLADPTINISADWTRLARAIGNLIDNAVKFTPSGGQVVLSARRCDAEITIEVTDTGEGISEEDLPKVFERFYRADKARTRTGGAGIGLAIVKHTVEAHGGSVEAYSEEGHGSKFIIRLPVTS